MNTGMVRKIDELGRLVIPKEIRNSLHIKNGEDVSIFIKEDMIVLKKSEKMLSINDAIQKLIDSLKKITNDINNKYGKSTENIILFNELINTNQGTEIIYALRNTNQLANKINNEFEKNNLQMNKFYQQRLPGDTSKDYYYITRETNPSETIIINYDLDEYQDFINYANSVALALIDYLNTKKEKTYTVVKGDSLYSIAKKFNTTVNNLKNINNLSTNLLSIGQILKIK